MLTIDWPGTEHEGWTDFIPMEWFSSTGIEVRSHPILGENDQCLTARLSVEVAQTSAILNYTEQYKEFNENQAIETGLIKVVFTDEKRQAIDVLLWKDAEADKEWVDAEADFGFDGDDAEAVEGDKKLAIHLRSERKPWLAVEKKQWAKRQRGFLECEACDADLRRLYGADIAFGIYEVHHREPVSGPARKTVLAALAILCPDCHRAIHRTGSNETPFMTVEAFRETLKESRP